MQINILYSPGAALAQCWLEAGETPLRAESGAMVGMSPNIDMETSSGGLKKGLKAMMGGESFFTNKFTSTSGTGEVLLAPSLPGDLNILEVEGGLGEAGNWSIVKGAFVGCDDTVEVETKFGGLKGMFSGAGLAHLKTSGQGQIIIGGFGSFDKVEVDGSFMVDNGHIVAWQSSLEYKISKSAKGFVGSFLSGEGYVCTFSGQGTVWIQTRNATEFGQLIGPQLPPR